VGTALRAGERAFFRVRAAVLGFGRIGKETARMLRALGADVTVYARRDATCEAAKREGLRARLLSDSDEIPCDLLFGTVPAPAPNLAALLLPPHALVYDLGGGLPDAFETGDGACVRTLPLRGAPGVFAPRAAGEIYGGAILDFIHTLERRSTV
jgi:dipicolinate synthase subunit A